MTYVDRLKLAFERIGDRNAAAIARRIDVPHTTATNYLKGRMPAAEVLIRVANETKVSLNWLLTGEGDITNVGQDLLLLMPHEMKWQVQKRAEATGKTIAEVVVNLAQEYLYEMGKVEQPEEQAVEMFEMSSLPDERATKVLRDWMREIAREELRKGL